VELAQQFLTMQVKLREFCQIKEKSLKTGLSHLIDKEYPDEKNTNGLLADLLNASEGSECPVYNEQNIENVAQIL